MSIPSAERAADLAFQDRILQGVSRTFALTIPELPPALREVVGNGYLLCRIADTIEDEPALGPERKRALAERFVAALAGEADPEAFAAELAAGLTPATLPAERELARETARVIRVTRGLRPRQRRALERCVGIMSRGMAEFAERASVEGLADLAELDRYCYHVAGVVGEMLTELFCDYSPEIDARREELSRLAVSFGQGLQMTNILKDVWEDRGRGACWLPRDVFERAGYDLRRLGEDATGTDPGFRAGLAELVGIARSHLGNALAYTLLLPREEAGIRRFCLWAIGMAVLTLRKIHAHPGFRTGREVKISRRSVRATVLVTSAAAGYDPALRLLFGVFTRALPGVGHHQRIVPV